MLAAIFLGTSLGAFGGELNQKLVPANSKWLLHVDGAGFRNSKIGTLLLNERLEPEVATAERHAGTNFSFSFKKIQSLTAFGSRVGEGGERDAVLLMETSADLRGDAEKLLAKKGANPSMEIPISKGIENGTEFFTVGGDLVVAPAGKNLWVLGKNKTATFAARDVALGKAPSIKHSNFLNSSTTNSFFILAAAETRGAGGLPAQAKILQNAEGLRITVGESGENLLINLALRAKDPETVSQMHDVLQGLKALATLGGTANEDLKILSSSAVILSREDAVLVTLNLPLARAMQKVREDK